MIVLGQEYVVKLATVYNISSSSESEVLLSKVDPYLCQKLIENMGK